MLGKYLKLLRKFVKLIRKIYLILAKNIEKSWKKINDEICLNLRIFLENIRKFEIVQENVMNSNNAFACFK